MARDYSREYQARKAREATKGRTVYEARVARLGKKGFTPSQAGGHAHGGAQSVSEFRSQPVWHVPFYAQTSEGGELVDPALTYQEAVEAGAYNALVRGLKENRVSPDEFESATRNVVIAGYPVVSHPATAVAMSLSIESSDLTFDSPRANAGRRT
jgi:hypothetical protein